MTGRPLTTRRVRFLAGCSLAAASLACPVAGQAGSGEPPIPAVLPLAPDTEPELPRPAVALRRLPDRVARAADAPLTAPSPQAPTPVGPAPTPDEPPAVYAQQLGGATYGDSMGADIALPSPYEPGFGSPGTPFGPGLSTNPFGGDLPLPPGLALPEEEGGEEQERPEMPLGPDDVEVIADAVQADDDVITAEGRVLIFYQDLILKADAAIVDFGDEKGYLHGNVIVDTPDLIATGDGLEIDLATSDWTFSADPPRRVHSRLEPRFFASGVSEPLYVSGYRITVLSRRPSDRLPEGQEELAEMPRRIVIDHGRLTSCDLDYPHWHLQTDSDEGVAIKPGHWATIERPTLYVLGHKVLTYPGKIPIDLKHRRFVLVPEVGYDRTQGYYAKFYHGYVGGPGGNGQGLFRLHLTTRRGIGAGVDHSFSGTEDRGRVSFFGQPKTGGYSGRAGYGRSWTPQLSTDFSGSFQTNTGYSTGTRTALENRLGIDYQGEGLSTRVSVMNSAYLSTTSTHRITTQVRHRHRVHRSFEYEIETDYRLYSRSGQPAADQELEVSFDASGDTRPVTWHLQTFKRYDPDGSRYPGDDTYRILNIMPNIRLNSSLARLGLPVPSRLLQWGSVPLNLELGRFVEEPSGTTLYRVKFRPDLTGYNRRFGEWGRLGVQPRFEQVWYDRHYAQYTTGVSSYFRAELPDDWHYDLQHLYVDPHGSAALRQDWTADSNRITSGLARRGEHTVLRFNTGYDLRGDQWQDLTASAQLQPTRFSRVSLQTGYSFRRDELRPITLRYDYANPDRLYMDLSTQYYPERGGLQRVRADIDWVINDKWEVETLLGYNAPTGRFDYADFRVVRDLHCWIAMLSYNAQQSEVRFQMSLKAFPWLSQYFGIGGRGQRLSPVPGVYF